VIDRAPLRSHGLAVRRSEYPHVPRIMKSLRRVPWLVRAALPGFTLLAGCVSSSSHVSSRESATRSDLPAVAIVVRIAGGSTTLSPREFTNIHQALRAHVTEAGYTFARNSDVADFLVTVRYTPDPLDADTGHVAITGMQPNPMKRRRTLTAAETSAEIFDLAKKTQDLDHRVSSQLTAAASNERNTAGELPTC
jgi:hypothetical protein